MCGGGGGAGGGDRAMVLMGCSYTYIRTETGASATAAAAEFSPGPLKALEPIRFRLVPGIHLVPCLPACLGCAVPCLLAFAGDEFHTDPAAAALWPPFGQ